MAACGSGADHTICGPQRPSASLATGHRRFLPHFTPTDYLRITGKQKASQVGFQVRACENIRSIEYALIESEQAGMLGLGLGLFNPGCALHLVKHCIRALKFE